MASSVCPCRFELRATPHTSRIIIQLNDEVIAWFRNKMNSAGGGDYQRLINEALEQYIQHQSQPLEAVVRRSVREERRSKKSARLNRTTAMTK